MVEVIVALAILGTTLIAIFGAIQTCSAANYHARMLTGAVLLAEKLLAETRLNDNPVFQSRLGQTKPYRWQVQLEPTPVENLAAIRVTIYWHQHQHTQSYELISLAYFKQAIEGK